MCLAPYESAQFELKLSCNTSQGLKSLDRGSHIVKTSSHPPQGSVKVRRGMKKTPHPPPCGPPSPQGRGIEIKITALSQGERGDRKAVGEGSLRGYYIYSSGGMLHAGL